MPFAPLPSHPRSDVDPSPRRAALRRRLRRARNGLGGAEQAAAALAVRDRLAALDFFRAARRVAFYHRFDGELDPAPLLAAALEDGKACFLPVTGRDDPGRLVFAPFDAGTALTENRWGIAEPPAPAAPVDPESLDLAFVPLVGFDRRCFRLGLGKGGYDRAFAFRRARPGGPPLLVGLAHACQLTANLPAEEWDVRLDAVATAGELYRPDGPAAPSGRSAA